MAGWVRPEPRGSLRLDSVPRLCAPAGPSGPPAGLQTGRAAARQVPGPGAQRLPAVDKLPPRPRHGWAGPGRLGFIRVPYRPSRPPDRHGARAARGASELRRAGGTARAGPRLEWEGGGLGGCPAIGDKFGRTLSGNRGKVFPTLRCRPSFGQCGWSLESLCWAKAVGRIENS